MSYKFISDVLAQRGDLSTFLVHLTRGEDDSPEERRAEAKARLKNILSSWTLRASTPMGLCLSIVREIQRDLVEIQKTVCFTETPLQYVHALLGEIRTANGRPRDCVFEPYGVALTKTQGRKRAINPVWYVHHDGTVGLSAEVIEAVKDALRLPASAREPILRLAPFFEGMGVFGGGQREFSWEREWRHIGDLSLPERVIILCPEQEMDEITQALSPNRGDMSMVDPRWSLERMLAKLAGFSDDEILPFSGA